MTLVHRLSYYIYSCQVAKLEEQLSRLMQSMPSDVSVTSKSTTPLSPPLQSSPSLAKSGRRRSAFELVRSSHIIRACLQTLYLCCPVPLEGSLR